jgi:hypothetical protein
METLRLSWTPAHLVEFASRLVCTPTLAHISTQAGLDSVNVRVYICQAISANFRVLLGARLHTFDYLIRHGA